MGKKIPTGTVNLFLGQKKLSGFLLPAVSGFCLVLGLVFLFFIRQAGFSTARIQSLEIRRDLNLEVLRQLETFLIQPSDTSYFRGEILVKTRSDYWGLFRKGNIKVTRGAFSDSIQFLFGKLIPLDLRFGLVMEDRGVPLVISGDAVIKGNSHLPGSGIIRNQRFEVRLPKKHNLEIGSSIPFDWNDLDRLLTFSHDQIKNANLTNHSEKFRIIETEFFIGDSSFEENHAIILCSKAIIKNGFRCQAQIIARSSILVDSGARFLYPSLLAVSGKGGSQIRLLSGSSVQGLIIGKYSDSEIFLEPGSLLVGEIYANGSSDTRGTIKGSLFSKLPKYNTGSGMFFSHLVGGKILPRYLPSTYCFSNHYPLRGRNDVLEFL